jgi:hypothetical protein
MQPPDYSTFTSYMGMCSDSSATAYNKSNWTSELGMDCENRLKFGCFENNAWMGEADRCTNNKDMASCEGPQTESCSEMVCSDLTATNCATRTSSADCNFQNGCTWTTQCCKWLAKPMELEDTCMNKGKGTMDGLCAYSDGASPPGKDIIAAGFEHSLFYKKEKYMNKCALVASFRNGSGSATVVGSNKKDMLGVACNATGPWEGLAEHIGHNKSTIEEYCMNFIPDASVMAALKAVDPAFAILKAEQGQFEALFPSLKDEKFVVTAKPEFGKCLFTAQTGKWGTGICTCDTQECNDQKALDLIVDPDMGPMRLLQFIDGSLSDKKNDINAVLPDLMTADGKLNTNKVGEVTEAHVDEIMMIEGMTDKTTKMELWNVTQDYQKLVQSEMDYKAMLQSYPTFQNVMLPVDGVDFQSPVAAVNEAAGVQLYDNDGSPYTYSMMSLSSSDVTAVAVASGIAEAHIQEAVVQSYNVEHGLAVNATTTTATSTAPPSGGNPTPVPGPTPAPVITSTGNVAVKMSQADADALTTSSEAKATFASAIAKTINVPAADVTITAIYVNGVQVNSTRRLQTDATVKVDWSVNAATAVETAAMDATTLKTNIETEAQAVANVAVAVTEAPVVEVVSTEVSTPEPTTAPTPAPTPEAASFALSSRRLGFVSFLTSCLFGSLL